MAKILFNDGVITPKSQMNIQRSFMACVNINHLIFAIGGYDYAKKIKLVILKYMKLKKMFGKKILLKI